MSTPTISLQLYTINNALTADPEGTLGRLRDIGFTTVEAYDFVRRADELAEAFARYGLRAATGHAFLASETVALPNGTVLQAPTHQDVFTAAKTLGIGTVIDPFVAPDRWQTRDQVRETADRLNAAAAAAADHGLRVGYHNHGHELTSVIDGQFGLEVLAESLDDAVVLEVDLYWATLGGADTPELLRRLGDRVRAVHVKDGTLDPELAHQRPPRDQVPAGQGNVPLTAALDAAPSVEYAVIEYDHYSGDLLDGVAKSYAFLAERGLS